MQVTGPIVTASGENFTSRCYVEQEDRAAGALVILGEGAALLRGTRAKVTGRVGQVGGERTILDSIMTDVFTILRTSSERSIQSQCSTPPAPLPRLPSTRSR